MPEKHTSSPLSLEVMGVLAFDLLGLVFHYPWAAGALELGCLAGAHFVDWTV